MDGGAWWAAVYGAARSRTRLKRLSRSSPQPAAGKALLSKDELKNSGLLRPAGGARSPARGSGSGGTPTPAPAQPTPARPEVGNIDE